MSDEEPMVPNPFISALETLMTRTENAVDQTPNMDAPTSSIGEGPAWTGSKARQLHDDHLAPNAEPVRSALNYLVEDVQAARNELEPEVPESVAKAMQVDLRMR